MNLTDEALEEWRAHPVSEAVKDALGRSITLQIAACKEAAWAGTPWSDAERLALHRARTLFDDIFEASADDFGAIMEIHE
jgi:hypothetical protein